MKTIQHKFIILVLIILSINRLSAQQMLVKGEFVSVVDRPLLSRYVIKTNGTTVASGRSKKIKVKLDINKNYTLTVIKPGYKSKTVHFSTFSVENFDLNISFLVLMQKESMNMESLNKTDFASEQRTIITKCVILSVFTARVNTSR